MSHHSTTSASPGGVGVTALPGVLVTVDGPGAVGKTTTISMLTAALTDAGLPVHATTQPSQSRLGDAIRHGTYTYRGMALACLVAGDRHHQLATEILPALTRGHIVLCDRYLPSSLVLQRRDGLTAAQIWQLNAGVRTPDLAVILTADPTTLTERLRVRGTHTRFETTGSPDGRTSSEVESDLYQLTHLELSQLGWPILTMNTSQTAPETMASQLTDTVTALFHERSQQCLT